MSLPFTGKVIAITGAASGLALATAYKLAERGASLSLADIQEEALERVRQDLRKKHKTDVITSIVDVRRADQVDKWINDTMEHFGRLDGGVNLAGVIGKSIGTGGIVDFDEDEWNFVIDVNLTGVMHCLRAQLKVIEDKGSVVSASSIAGLQGRAYNAAYTASKHGVLGLTRSAAKEVGNRGVRVNAICPGYIDTPMTALSSKFQEAAGKNVDQNFEAMGVALGRAGKAEEVASLVCFLLGDESTFITGATYTIDGGWVC